ncbi:MAG: hypothetical protein U0228_23835 [Myxococcaceae bacterium]
MLSLVVSVALAAAPLTLVGTKGDDHGAVLASLKKAGAGVVDGVGVYQYLFDPPGVLPLQDFEGFTAKPLGGWPVTLNKAWSAGLTACANLVGPPPWKDTLATAVSCGNRLSLHLWQRFAAASKATQVLEVDVVKLKETEAEVRGRLWVIGQPRQRSLTQKVAPEAVGGAVLEVVTELLGNGGTEGPRAEVEMLGPAVADSWVGKEPSSAAAVKLKTSCAALPAKLEVEGGGALGKSLVARWSPEGASGAALKCSLTFNEQTEQTEVGALRVITNTLTCGKTVVAVQLANIAPKPMDGLSEKLSQALAARLCRGQ